MRSVTVATILIALCIGSTAFGQGSNPGATFVLHANDGGTCTTGSPPLPDCVNTQPVVDVNASTIYRIFFFLNNASNIAAIDAAFEWDDTWNIDPNEIGVTYTACTTNTISVSTPQDPGGPNSGRLVSAFDCITANFVSLGRMEFMTGTQGCIEFVDVNDVFGTHIVDCANGRDEFDHTLPSELLRFGKVCVGSGGHNACAPIVAVEPTTWGKIKETYSR